MGFIVLGLGFWVQGVGFEVWGFGFRFVVWRVFRGSGWVGVSVQQGFGYRVEAL